MCNWWSPRLGRHSSSANSFFSRSVPPFTRDLVKERCTQLVALEFRGDSVSFECFIKACFVTLIHRGIQRRLKKNRSHHGWTSRGCLGIRINPNTFLLKRQLSLRSSVIRWDDAHTFTTKRVTEQWGNMRQLKKRECEIQYRVGKAMLTPATGWGNNRVGKANLCLQSESYFSIRFGRHKRMKRIRRIFRQLMFFVLLCNTWSLFWIHIRIVHCFRSLRWRDSNKLWKSKSTRRIGYHAEALLSFWWWAV